MKFRDPLLDVWRGLALVDMVWVHLAFVVGLAPWLVVWIGDYTRFAAGAFVLISGITVARVFGPKLVGGRATVTATRWHLWRRALLLAFLDRLVAVVYVVIDQFRLVPPSVPPNPPAIEDLLYFREPGVTGGLLFLYSLLLAVTPLLDVARRRFGAGALVAASLGMYVLAYLAGGGVEGGYWPFPVLYWQPLFVIGYVLSPPLARWRMGGGRVSAWWLVFSAGCFTLLFLARNGAALGLSPALPLGGLVFVKVPLSPAELVWYLAVSGFVLIWSAWAWDQATGRRWSPAWLCQLGRYTLLIYVAHLLIEPPILELVTLLDPPPLVRLTALPLSLIVLVKIAAMAESVKRARAAAPEATRRGLPIGGIMGSAVAAGAVGVVMTLQVVIGPPPGWTETPMAGMLSQAPLPVEEDLLVAVNEGEAAELTPSEEPMTSGESPLSDPSPELETAAAVSET